MREKTIYKPSIYICSSNNHDRFALGHIGKKTLFVIGVNPSTASDISPDNTMTKTHRHSEILGFDGYVMFNLSSQRSTKPVHLDERSDRFSAIENIGVIRSILKRQQNIHMLAAWGETIMNRPYLFDNLKEICNQLKPLKVSWYHLGPLTRTGHPRHLSRTAYSLRLIPFHIEGYIERWRN